MPLWDPLERGTEIALGSWNAWNASLGLLEIDLTDLEWKIS